MILLQGLYCCAVGNGPETGTGISQVVFDGVLIKERCSSVWRTPALRKINGFQVRAGILDAADVVFRRAASYGLCELFPICRVVHRDHVGYFGHGLGQVQEVVPEGKALVIVLGHVAIQIVKVVVASEAGGRLEAFVGAACIDHMGQPVGAQCIAVGIGFMPVPPLVT